uniref:Uncharacterized protein n=1 Tax=Anguilla anguilla TaxID=7936 RepID=A0A0E9UDW2_ANGAN
MVSLSRMTEHSGNRHSSEMG